MDLPRLLRRQDSVVTRAQALDRGLSPRQIEWRTSTGRWQRLHRGVYYVHSGPVPWRSRTRAALLHAGAGAALAEETALYVWRLGPRPAGSTRVAVPADRHLARTDGVTVRRRRRLVVREVDGFPVTSVAQTLVDLTNRPGCNRHAVVALVARACQQGRVTGEQLLDELARRRTHRHRRLLRMLLIDSGGVESVPEFLFVHRVERAHGLPRFERQVRDAGTRRDFWNRRYRVAVEIDGAAHHAGERFHTDRRRDRRASRRGTITLRGTWWDIDSAPCEFAIDVGLTLRERGWPGRLVPCSTDCPVAG